MKNSYKNYFNMVEVALALAVVGIGIAGVMSLFPVGFNSIRDAMAESYSADAVEEFMTQISRVCKNNWDAIVWNDATNSDRNIIPNQKGGDSTPWNDDTGSNSDNDSENPSLTWCSDAQALFGNIYFNNADGNGQPDTANDFRVFKLVRKSGGIVDFEAAVRIWKQPIRNLNVAGQNINFEDMPNFKYKYGLMLYAEVSWPYSKPYSKREKRVYCKEIFRPM